MHLVYLLFIATINSIDNLAIGIAYSVAKIKIPLFKNILISFMAFAVSFFSALCGNLLSSNLSEKSASIISLLLLIFIGTRMIFDSYKNQNKNGKEAMKIIGNKEAISLGAVLALDDIGGSVSSGLIGYGPFSVALPFFLVSFIIFILANYGTNLTSKLKIGKNSSAIGGALIIIIALLKYIY